MHRHGYQGRKLSLPSHQRRALIRSQVTSLVLYESIKTTEARAKEIAPYFERMVTHAKKSTLAGNRALREFLMTENAVQKMVQELKPAFAERQGGYTRVIKSGNRRGDNAPMAVVSLVLPDKPVKTETPKDAKAEKADKADTKSKTSDKTKKVAEKKS